MELTKNAQIDSFLNGVEFCFSDLTKLERFEMGSVFDRTVMKTHIGGLFTAYIAMAFNLISYIYREDINSFFEDINHYREMTLDQIYDVDGIEGLEREYKKFIDIIINTNIIGGLYERKK